MRRELLLSLVRRKEVRLMSKERECPCCPPECDCEDCDCC